MHDVSTGTIALRGKNVGGENRGVSIDNSPTRSNVDPRLQIKKSFLAQGHNDIALGRPLPRPHANTIELGPLGGNWLFQKGPFGTGVPFDCY